MLFLLLSQAAFAQATNSAYAFNTQNYRPPVDSEMLLWTDDASLKPDLWWSTRIWGSYVKNPLVYEYADTTLDDDVLVGDVLQLDLIPAFSFKHIRLGVDLPLYLTSSGDQVNTGSGLGDIALDLKGTILDTDDAPLGLALAGRMALPTATVDAPLGNDGLGGELSLIVDRRFGDLLLAANLGTRFMPEIALDGATLNDQFLWRLGAGYAITDDNGVSVDIAGMSNYSEPLSNAAASPIEFMVGGWQRISNYVLRAGIGTGMTEGIGSPDFRAVLAFSYEPPPDRDTDLDGLVDRLDDCPEDPEDKDGYMDEDGCPDPSTPTMFRFVDDEGYAVEGVQAQVDGPGMDPTIKEGAFELSLHPGDFQITADAPGYDTATLTAPVPEASAHEIVVTMQAVPGVLVLKVVDPEGKPAAFQWSLGQGFTDDPDGNVDTQVKPGRYILRVQAEGYMAIRQPVDIAPGDRLVRDFVLQPSKIVVTKEKIELNEEVYFDTGKATIKTESFSMLTEVANVLKDNPDITQVSIEGHTDSRGSATFNKSLSERRAASVRQYLVDQGVEPDRLVSKGWGEEKPLVRGNNEAAWAKNRRVDIFILEREEQGE